MKFFPILILSAFVSLPAWAVTPVDQKICEKILEGEDTVDLAKIEEAVDKKLAAFIKDNMRLPTVAEVAEAAGVRAEDAAAVYDATNVDFAALRMAGARALETARNKLISAYAKVVRETRRIPTIEELAEVLGVRVEDLNALIGGGKLFEDLAELKARTQKKRPTAFRNAIDTDVFTAERKAKMIDAVKSRKRLIVTTAVAGSPVNRTFFESLQTYAKQMDADIIVYPADMVTTGLDPILFETPGVHVMVDSVELSPWLNLNNVKIMAKTAWPLDGQGLDRLGPRGQTQIIASPKMHTKIIPTTDNKVNPHMLATTGAVTDPVYSKFYRPLRAEVVAMSDHFLGALVLERNNGGADTMGISTAGTYHIRGVEFIPEKGGFTDLGRFYSASGVKKAAPPEALVLGDIHVGDTDQTLLESLKRQIFLLKPKVIVLHDLLNGHSVSHHDRHKLISMGQKAKEGLLDLEKEIHDVVTFLNSMLAMDSSLQVVIVPSNHNFWLHRWLDEGEFMKDNKNRSIGLDLAKAFKDGEDPVEYALVHNGLEPAKVKRINFMRTGGRYKVGPDNRLVELGQHGHAGANGAKGSMKSMQRGNDRVVFGHTHTTQRLNGSVNVGTSTTLVLPYSREGMSNWSQSLAIVGENGEIQILRLQDGEWYTGSAQEPLADDVFFMPGYPR